MEMPDMLCVQYVCSLLKGCVVCLGFFPFFKNSHCRESTWKTRLDAGGRTYSNFTHIKCCDSYKGLFLGFGFFFFLFAVNMAKNISLYVSRTILHHISET